VQQCRGINAGLHLFTKQAADGKDLNNVGTRNQRQPVRSERSVCQSAGQAQVFACGTYHMYACSLLSTNLNCGFFSSSAQGAHGWLQPCHCCSSQDPQPEHGAEGKTGLLQRLADARPPSIADQFLALILHVHDKTSVPDTQLRAGSLSNKYKHPRAPQRCQHQTHQMLPRLTNKCTSSSELRNAVALKALQHHQQFTQKLKAPVLQETRVPLLAP
jgi:hypothetical protein